MALREKRPILWVGAPLILLLALCACSGGGSSSGGSGGGGGGRASHQVTISYVEPNVMMAGIPTPLINVRGNNFTGGAQVFMDGVPADQTSYESPNLLVAEFLADLPVGVHQVTINGTSISNALPLTVYVPPQGPQVMQAPSGFYTGVFNLTALATGDLNKDGRSDVIVAGLHSGLYQLGVMYGQADGTLSAAQYIPLHAAINTVVAGDVDGDGNQDLIAVEVSASGATVNVLLGDGQGNFQAVAPSQTFPAQASEAGLLVDVDGDGEPDLVLGYQTDTLLSTQDVIWLKNLGGGNFGPPNVLATNTANDFGFTVADFDRDGKPDIIYSAVGPPQSLRFLKNLGNGQFSDQPVAGINGTFGSPTAIDFNLDGIPDLFVEGNGFFYSFAGNGDGSFTLVGTGMIPGQAGFVKLPLIVGDFDHDGLPDLAGGSISNEPASMFYLFGDGHGNFSPQVVVGPYGYFSVVGDFNGDGLADVAIADPQFFVSLSLGRTDRNFPSAAALTPNKLGVVSTGDVLGNGLREVFVSGDSNTIQGNMFQNLGNNTFQMASSMDPAALAIVDMTGRGKADLLQNSFSGVLLIWPNNGTIDFSGSTPVSVPLTPQAVGLQVADMDGDGHPDIIELQEIWYGNGAYQFKPVAAPITWPYVIGDFNGDGKLDFIAGGSTYLNAGNRSFQTVQNNNLPLLGSGNATVGDFNGDGKDDVVLTGMGPSTITIYYSNGDGTFYRGADLDCGQPPTAFGVADFAGTGRNDLVVALQGSYQACILFNQGNGQFARSFFATGANAIGMITQDLNGDHKPDVVISNFPFTFRPPNVNVVSHK